MVLGGGLQREHGSPALVDLGTLPGGTAQQKNGVLSPERPSTEFPWFYISGTLFP